MPENDVVEGGNQLKRRLTDEDILGENQGIGFAEASRNTCSTQLSILLSFTISLSLVWSNFVLDRMSPAANGTDAFSEEEWTAFRASIAIDSTYFNTFLVAAISILFGVAPYGNNRQGALTAAGSSDKSSDEVRKIEDTICFINTVTTGAAIVLSGVVVLFYAYAEQLLTLLGQDALVAKYTGAHLLPWVAGTTMVMIRIGFEQSLVPAGKQHVATGLDWIFFLAACALSYCLPMFVWPNWDFMLRIAVVSACFAAESWPTTLINLVYMMYGKGLKRFRFFREWKFDRVDKVTALKAMGSQSGPSFLNTITEFVMSFAVTSVAGLISLDGQAALSPSMQLFNLTLLISLAMGFSSAAMAGNAAGEGNVQKTQQYFKASHFLTLSTVGLISLTILIYPRLLRLIFSSDYDSYNFSDSNVNESTTPVVPFNETTAWVSDDYLNQQTDKLTRYMGGVIFLDSWRFLAVALMRSQGGPWPALLLSSCGQLIGLSLGIALGFCTDLEVSGLLIGWIVGGGLAVAGLLTQIVHYYQEEQIQAASKRIENPSCGEVSRICGAMFTKCRRSPQNRSRQQSVRLEDVADLAKRPVTALTASESTGNDGKEKAKVEP